MRADPRRDRVGLGFIAKVDRDAPPVRSSAERSSLSQRGVQPRGNRRSDTTISASAQALVMVVQSICVAERVASKCHAADPLRITAMQASFEHALNGLDPRTSGSPSNPDASAISERT